MAGNTEYQDKYRKIAAALLVAGFVVLFFVVTPLPETSPFKTAGMVAAFLLFPASIYFNFKARPQVALTLQLRQSIAILVAFLVMSVAIGLLE